jgi:hypothetical protein
MHTEIITTASERGALLEDDRRGLGHREPGTTKLYARRGYNQEKA